MKKRRIIDLTLKERAKLAREAGLKAIKETLDAGFPVTGAEGDNIVRTYPDGRKEVIGKIRRHTPIDPKGYQE